MAKIDKLLPKQGYDWKFSTVGGVARVNIETGDDIAHLDELDQNIEYGYCFSINGNMAADVLKISGAKEASEAAKAIEAAGFKLLTQADLA